MWRSIALTSLCLLPAAATAAPPGVPQKIAGYERRTIHGFTVFINQEVLDHDEDPKFKRRPTEVLDLELSTLTQALPERSLKILRRLLIWVEWDDKNDPDAGRAIAKYYGVFGNRAVWRLAQTKHPLKANNVEIINMRALTLEHQPNVKLERCVILHEMVHAAHFHRFGVQNANIRSAYTQAIDRGLYNEAIDVYGRMIRPYARVSEAEYFAEISCAYLNKLHYHPFDREGLKEHDPAGYNLMVWAWGQPKALEAVKKADAEKVAYVRLLRARNLSTIGRKEEARALLNELIRIYPETPSGGEAKQLLERLKNGPSEKTVSPTP